MPATLAKPKTSLRGLRTFCVAARYESFSTAADALFITASAISHQIKSLEEELGLQLFDRNSRELSLTEVGRALYEDINPLIEQLDEAAAKFRKGTTASSIRVSVQPFFASEFFVPRLSEFTANHPEIDIHVGTSDESAEKHPADADLSIRLFSSPPVDMESNLLCPLKLLPVGSPDFAAALKVKKKVIESEFPLIVHESHPKAWTQWSKSSGVKLPESPKVTRLDSMIAVVRAAQRGIGAALVPMPITQQWIAEGGLVPLFKHQLVTKSSYYLVCRKDRVDDPAVSLLRNWIRENLSA